VARGVSSFVFVSVGAGVGLGIVINDELVRGAHGAAGEIGYLPSGVDPLDQRHRLRGGLEDEIGAAGILAAFQAGDPGDKPPESAQEVFELAEQGHPGAAAVVDTVARRLGTAIATVSAVLDPELVVLGGGIGSNRSLVAPVRSALAALVPLAARVESSQLGNRAALYGALAVALRRARDEALSPGIRDGAVRTLS
jgi:predicted NBD/HSP70 family sugar kinase